jgi:hypothetical protein
VRCHASMTEEELDELSAEAERGYPVQAAIALAGYNLSPAEEAVLLWQKIVVNGERP